MLDEPFFTATLFPEMPVYAKVLFQLLEALYAPQLCGHYFSVYHAHNLNSSAQISNTPKTETLFMWLAVDDWHGFRNDHVSARRSTKS